MQILLLLQILSAVLQIILKWQESGKQLSGKEKVRLNAVIARCRRLEGQAVLMGCRPGGEDATFTDEMDD